MAEQTSPEQVIVELLKLADTVTIRKSPDGMFTITVGSVTVSSRSLAAALAAVAPQWVAK